MVRTGYLHTGGILLMYAILEKLFQSSLQHFCVFSGRFRCSTARKLVKNNLMSL